MNTRPTAVAGSFYPDDAMTLNKQLQLFLDSVGTQEHKPIKAIVVPHAGYIYSGEIAATAFAQLQHRTFERVILLGPSHRVAFSGIAACNYQRYETPGASIELDQLAMQRMVEQRYASYIDDAHRWEHSLEVQVPFIQYLFPEARLVPLVVGDAKWRQVSALLDSCYQQTDLIVISTDLSHYHSYTEAKGIDRATNKAILNYQKDIQGNQACGCIALSGLLDFAKQQNWCIECVDLRNSGDTAGTKDRVVGYGAYTLY